MPKQLEVGWFASASCKLVTRPGRASGVRDCDGQVLEGWSIGIKRVLENHDTTTPGGKLVFHVFRPLSEFERDLIRERTKARLAAARARGRKGERPALLDEKKRAVALQLHADLNVSITDICKMPGISRTTFYHALGRNAKRELMDARSQGPFIKPAHEEGGAAAALSNTAFWNQLGIRSALISNWVPSVTSASQICSWLELSKM